MSIELAKAKLQSALERIEEVIDHKVAFLELENNNLRAEIIKLKHEIKKFAANSNANAAAESIKKFEPQIAFQADNTHLTNEPAIQVKKPVSTDQSILKAERPSNQNSESNLLSRNAASEIDISLSKLKKLVG